MQEILMGLMILVASCISFLAGSGLSTLSTPLLLFFLPFEHVLILVAIIQWFHSLTMIYFFYKKIDTHIFWYFGIPSIVSVIIGASLAGMLPSNILIFFLGCILITYTLFFFMYPHFVLPQRKSIHTLGGTITGFLAGLVGIRGPIRSMFFSALDLPKEVYISTTGCVVFLVDSIRICVYWINGLFVDYMPIYQLYYMIPLSFLGVGIGKLLLQHITQSRFRVIVLLCLGLMGVALLLLVLWG